MTRRPWTKAELRTVRTLYADTVTADIAEQLGRSLATVYNMARKMGLQKAEGFAAEVARVQMAIDGHGARATQFRKGQAPPNKGLRRPGYAAGRMAETQFKKGQKCHNWLPLGACRYSKEGYLQQKCSDTGYPPNDWVPVHHLVWEEETGKRVPKGMRLLFRDGDKTNFDFDNLELVTPAEMMRRNTIHNLPPELKEVIVLKGAINRHITMRRKRAQEQTV